MTEVMQVLNCLEQSSSSRQTLHPPIRGHFVVSYKVFKNSFSPTESFQNGSLIDFYFSSLRMGSSKGSDWLISLKTEDYEA